MAIDIRDAKPESPTSRRGPRLPFFGGILKFVALLGLLAVAAGPVSFAAG